MITSDLSTLLVDQDVWLSLLHYFRHGLEPGSFATACLLGDYELAHSKAHAMLKAPYKGQDIIKNMIDLAQRLPSCARGSMENIQHWQSHNGLERATPEMVVLSKLEWNEIFGEFHYSFRK